MRARHVLPILLAVWLGGCASPTPPSADVKISQTARGVEIRSSDKILFDSGKADIKPEGREFLDRVAAIVLHRTRKPVSIEGHTDNVGLPELNRDLSELRALAVMKALLDRGVPKARMSYVGYGMSRPIADNSTAEGRLQNRRTEIIILDERREVIGGGPLDELSRSVGAVLDFGKRLFH